ncbi:hypothetical protein SDC9_148689 [bioreactor metagenome]|uniref:Peptidase S11 D-Ala-D-Ala carboxypeptidase A C-terminal domain-containing protein n=1 Tax=bioreactor metagenome TaxID=1076179 RepID=A0A645EJH6_9ZZZZ
MKLFDYAFGNFYTCTLIEKGPTSKVIPVAGGQSSFCCTCFANDFKITLKKDDPLPEVVYCLPKFAYAPIKTNQLAGFAKVIQNGQMIGEVNIQYIASVNTYPYKNPKESIIKKIISFLLESFGISS